MSVDANNFKVDGPTIDKEHAMERLDNDDELYGELVQLFLEDSIVRIESLRNGLENKDCRVAEREAHSIKSAAANIGGERVRCVAGQIEKVLRESGDMKQGAQLFQLLECELEQLKEELAK